MSSTSTPNRASVLNTVDVTPGRSLPVSVINRVFGASSFMAVLTLSPCGGMSAAGRTVSAMTHTHHALDYVEIAQRHVAAAKDFYGSAFGWQFNDYGPDYAGIRSSDGEREVGGLNGTTEPSPGGPMVLLWSDDLDATVTAVEAAGGTVVTPPFEFPGGAGSTSQTPAGPSSGSGRSAELQTDAEGHTLVEQAATSALRLARSSGTSAERRASASAALMLPPSSSRASSTMPRQRSASVASRTARAGITSGSSAMRPLRSAMSSSATSGTPAGDV